MDTIYTNFEVIQQLSITPKNDGKKREGTVDIHPSLYNDNLYACLIFCFKRKEGNFQERVAFNNSN